MNHDHHSSRRLYFSKPSSAAPPPTNAHTQAEQNTFQLDDIFEDIGQRQRPAPPSSLFHVVLAQQGFSDLRTGKVLSILLSITYPEALELMRRTPSTIVWNVPREQALQIKSLVEKTGAKIKIIPTSKDFNQIAELLSPPGRFDYL